MHICLSNKMTTWSNGMSLVCKPGDCKFEPCCWMKFFFIFLCILRFLGLLGGLGVRKHPQNSLFTSSCLIHETSISVSSSLSCLSPIFADWRKLAEHSLKITFVKFYLVKKHQKCYIFEFPRSNSKIKLWGYPHIQPVPPTPLPCPQVSKSNYNHSWPVCLIMYATNVCKNCFNIILTNAGAKL